MKQIGLDARMVRHTGIGTYVQGLLEGFKTASFAADSRLTLLGPAETLREIAPNINSSSFNPPIYSFSEQRAYPGVISGYDLWHSPHYNIPYFKKKTKLVVTVHDLIHWIYRKDFFSPAQAFYAGTMFKRVVKTADHIIAVSQHTANDLKQHFSADPAKITVIYESVGVHHKRLSDDKIRAFRKDMNLPENFFLYVGSLKPHKNTQTLLKVFRKLKKENRIKSSLVLVGRKDKKYGPALTDLQNLETGGGVYHFSEANRAQLTGFYSSALSLVHPSLYEGFGLTPLEAMACETPVIASNTSSIPEVVGSAALLMPPKDENKMAEALLRMEQDASLRSELKKQGTERLKVFSWEKTARQTLDVYRKVLQS